MAGDGCLRAVHDSIIKYNKWKATICPKSKGIAIGRTAKGWKKTLEHCEETTGLNRAENLRDIGSDQYRELIGSKSEPGRNGVCCATKADRK